MGAKMAELGLSEVEKLSSVVRVCNAAPGSVRTEGEYFVAVEPNSFGIPSVETCPGRTDECESVCYAKESEYRDRTAEKLQRNLDTLHEAETVEAMAEKLRAMVGQYVERANRMGVPDDSRQFRIHWSGDFFSVDYAEAWRIVIEENPDIKFYTYTRSFQPDVNVVPVLAGLENLDLFLSVDNQNVDRASEVLPDYPDVRAAYLVKHFEQAKPLIAKLGREENYRSLPCPENVKDATGKRKLPVISKKGGACSVCTYCIDKPKNWDVIFIDDGRPQTAMVFDKPVPVELKPRRRTSLSDTAQATGQLVLAEAAPSLF